MNSCVKCQLQKRGKKESIFKTGKANCGKVGGIIS